MGIEKYRMSVEIRFPRLFSGAGRAEGDSRTAGDQPISRSQDSSDFLSVAMNLPASAPSMVR